MLDFCILFLQWNGTGYSDITTVYTLMYIYTNVCTIDLQPTNEKYCLSNNLDHEVQQGTINMHTELTNLYVSISTQIQLNFGKPNVVSHLTLPSHFNSNFYETIQFANINSHTFSNRYCI